jgi:hypothetical protein
MPLDRDTRYHLEIAIRNHIAHKELTSERILSILLKENYRVALDLRRVVAICSAMERRGAFISRQQGETTFWRINPNFYKDHPDKSIFGEHVAMKPQTFLKSINRRTLGRKKKQYPSQYVKKKDF